jgi:hypothetical protein
MDQGGSPITWLLIQLFTWQNVVGFIVIGAIYFTGVLLTWRRARAFMAAEKKAVTRKARRHLDIRGAMLPFFLE